MSISKGITLSKHFTNTEVSFNEELWETHWSNMFLTDENAIAIHITQVKCYYEKGSV